MVLVGDGLYVVRGCEVMVQQRFRMLGKMVSESGSWLENDAFNVLRKCQNLWESLTMVDCGQPGLIG